MRMVVHTVFSIVSGASGQKEEKFLLELFFRWEKVRAEAALEARLKEQPKTQDADGIYGHSLFAGKSMDVFRTTDGAQAPDTYVLGEGDEVHISIFGSSQTEIHQRIEADGSIQPAGSTKIFLKGLTKEMEKILTRRGYTVLFGSTEEDPERFGRLVQSFLERTYDSFE